VEKFVENSASFFSLQFKNRVDFTETQYHLWKTSKSRSEKKFSNQKNFIAKVVFSDFSSKIPLKLKSSPENRVR